MAETPGDGFCDSHDASQAVFREIRACERKQGGFENAAAALTGKAPVPGGGLFGEGVVEIGEYQATATG